MPEGRLLFKLRWWAEACCGWGAQGWEAFTDAAITKVRGSEKGLKLLGAWDLGLKAWALGLRAAGSLGLGAWALGLRA